MTDMIKERVAENLIALLPFYHKKIFWQGGQGITGMQAAQYPYTWCPDAGRYSPFHV